MSLEHKAFEFDWQFFKADFLAILHNALASNDVVLLHSYIEENVRFLVDPYEGEPLNLDWRMQIENVHDVHTLGDFAITRFYDPSKDCGIGSAWLDCGDCFTNSSQIALLDQTVGPSFNPFDPGKMGSYFQSPDEVSQSFELLSKSDNSLMTEYLSFLRSCLARQSGLYVTF